VAAVVERVVEVEVGVDGEGGKGVVEANVGVRRDGVGEGGGGGVGVVVRPVGGALALVVLAVVGVVR